MQTKRLFTGTYIDKEIFEDVYVDMLEDFNGISTGKWVEPENLHFTYHFIGDFDSSKIPDLINELKSTCKTYKSELVIKGISGFPNILNPRILHAEVIDYNNILQNIFSNLERRLIPFGYKPESRKFTPHVTLQRIKSIKKDEFNSIIQDYSDFEFGKMSKFNVNLIESELTPRGPVYRILF